MTDLKEKEIIKQVLTALLIKFGNAPMPVSKYLDFIAELEKSFGQGVYINFNYTTNGYIYTKESNDKRNGDVTVHISKKALELLK